MSNDVCARMRKARFVSLVRAGSVKKSLRFELIPVVRGGLRLTERKIVVLVCGSLKRTRGTRVRVLAVHLVTSGIFVILHVASAWSRRF
jgi:hypothetical protein